MRGNDNTDWERDANATDDLLLHRLNVLKRGKKRTKGGPRSDSGL
jgi:hypothetical protein